MTSCEKALRNIPSFSLVEKLIQEQYLTSLSEEPVNYSFILLHNHIILCQSVISDINTCKNWALREISVHLDLFLRIQLIIFLFAVLVKNSVETVKRFIIITNYFDII